MAKFASVDEFYSALPEDQRTHISSLVEYVSARYPELNVVIAWNQPMFKSGDKYVLGFMPTKKHTNLLTVSDTAITAMAAELSGYKHGTRSISLPFDWQIDPALIDRVVQLRAQELGLNTRES